MDIIILEPTWATLGTVARAMQVCENDSSNATPIWKSQMAFCSSLQSMLESIIACFPPKSEYSTHHQELDLLIQMILQPLYCFYSETMPCMSTLENSWGPLDSRQDIAQLDETLIHSVIPSLSVLEKQVLKDMEGINTMLLLYLT